MAKYQDGEFICRSDYDCFFVRGHVSDDVAYKAVLDGAGVDSRCGTIDHEYGRWVPARNHPDHDLFLHICEPGRGAFPVTVVSYV